MYILMGGHSSDGSVCCWSYLHDAVRMPKFSWYFFLRLSESNQLDRRTKKTKYAFIKSKRSYINV